MNNALSLMTGNNNNALPAGAQPAPLSAAEWVDLNNIVQQGILLHQQKIKALQAIIRYDRLPQVMGNTALITQAFYFMLNSIIYFPPAGTKLFIYIKCEKEQTETLDLTLPAGSFYYSISVYTNITTDTVWQQLQDVQLESVKLNIHRLNGSFSFHSINNTGCLYNLRLPGK